MLVINWVQAAPYSATMAAVHSSASVPIIPLCLGVIALFVALIVMHHPVREPKCALIFRLATLHRVAGTGYVFVLPFFEHIEDELYLGPRELQVTAPLSMPSEARSHMANVNVTWRIHTSVRGRPSASARDTLLLPDELRAKLVSETVAHTAGWALLEYRQDDLTFAATRESVAHTIACAANAELAPCGLHIERIFWRD